MKRNTMELPLPQEVKQLARLDNMQEKLKLFEDVIHEYEQNLQATADLQCEITEALKNHDYKSDILFLKACRAIAYMTKNMDFYRECLVYMIPRLKERLKVVEKFLPDIRYERDVETYHHNIMLAEQELSDLEKA